MPLTEKQIEERVNYLGGSDASGILGLSRYKTPLSVWAIKTGAILPQDISEEMPVKLGNMLEEAVCKLFEEETGKVLLPAKDTLFHPKYPFIGGNLDRLVQGERAFFEAKTTNSYKQSEWENADDEIPVEYIMQCYHYLIVTGLDRAYIGCLIGNRKFVWRTIERNEQVLAGILAKEINFWNNFVVPKVMPMQISSEDSGVLYSLFPQAAPESIIELDDDAQKIAESLDSMQADYKVLEKEIDKQKNELRARLKTYDTGLTAKYKITWRNQKERRLNAELLKKEEPGIYEKYSPEKEKRVLRLSVRR